MLCVGIPRATKRRNVFYGVSRFHISTLSFFFCNRHESIGDHIQSLDYGRKHKNFTFKNFFSLFEKRKAGTLHRSFIIASTEQRNNIPTATHVQREVPSRILVLALAIGLPALEGPLEYDKLTVSRSKKAPNHCFHSVWRVFRSSTHAFSESSTVNNHGARASSCS